MEPEKLLDALENSTDETIALAGQLREKSFGNTVDPCSIINARSGNCTEDCAFCAQSVHHETAVETYPLIEKERILAAAKKARGYGVRRFCIVTSGRGIYSDPELRSIAECITAIREMGMLPCATLGELDMEQLLYLKKAGLNRYHHNIETSRAFFPNICTTHTYDDRLTTLRTAKDAGLSICSGGIMGMGETMQDRAEMALALRELEVDSVPLNFLMPIPGTPLGHADFVAPLEALKTIALFRHILPDREIRVCGGRMSALGEMHRMVFSAGANGILMGDYLTTKGRGFPEDMKMLSELGLALAYA